ncbi:MAG: amidohydrolase, partial [Acetobacteraceae bacterium]
DRRDPEGRLWPGLKSIEDVVERLQQVERELSPDAALLAWGFDPIFFRGRRMTTKDLDQVSGTRPIVIMHASFHVINVNTAVLRKARISADTKVHGIVLDESGGPTGELQEMAAQLLALRIAGEAFWQGSAAAVLRYGNAAKLAGVTTVTDLYNDLTDATVEDFRQVTQDAGFPARLVPAYNPSGLAPADGVARLRALVRHNTDKLRFGLVKLMTDGSIQGYTARLKWPGYYNGRPNGLWNMAPDTLFQYLSAFHRAGFQIHVHANGDEASEVTLNAFERALSEAPRSDHRHTLQHCQMADASQFRRMAKLGLCANLFANHIYYWGDAHYADTMGPDRANRMNATATANRLGVPIALHSDAPITPLAPLFTAWCAVNRRTVSGRVLGPSERLDVAEALFAITIGAAYTLKLDAEIGSIEVGKFADFAVLEDDPTAVPPERLKDVRIWGTMLGGQIYPGPELC